MIFQDLGFLDECELHSLLIHLDYSFSGIKHLKMLFLCHLLHKGVPKIFIVYLINYAQTLQRHIFTYKHRRAINELPKCLA